MEIAAHGRELFIGSNPDEKRELLGLLGSNLLLDGKKVQITLYSPFDKIASCNERSEWLPTIEEVITVIKQDLAVN